MCESRPVLRARPVEQTESAPLQLVLRCAEAVPGSVRSLRGTQIGRDAEVHQVAETRTRLLREDDVLRAEAVCSEVLRSEACLLPEAVRSEVLRSSALPQDRVAEDLHSEDQDRVL
jgi:hypothetical protein